MNSELAQSMSKKGWSPKEVEHLDRSLERFSEQSEHPLFDQTVFWIAMILALVGNFVLGVVFIPFLLVMTTLTASMVVFLLGACFGVLFLGIVKGLQGPAHQHRVIAWMFLPVVALVTAYVVTSLTNKFAVVLNISLSHQPIVVGAVYAFSLILPYGVSQVWGALERKKA